MRAFEALVRRGEESVYRIAYRVVGRASDAEDVRQEVFLALYTRPERLPEPERYEAWLRRCTVNAAIACVRRRRRSGDSEPPDEIVSSHVGDPGELAVDRDESRRLEAALGRLPPDDRAILSLRFDERLTFAEIAEILGRPASTLKSRYARLLERLRFAVESPVPEPGVPRAD